MTQIFVKQGSIQFEETPLVIVGLFEGEDELDSATAAVDRALSGAIREVVADGDFSGKKGEILRLYSRGGLPARRVLVVGLGKKNEFDLEAMRQTAASAARSARDLKVTRYTTVVHGVHSRLGMASAAQALVEGILLGLYRFSELKSPDEDEDRDVETVTVMESDGESMADLQEGARVGEIVAAATCLARDLSNRPANVATPSYLAAVAQNLADEFGLRCRILGPEEIAMEAMGGLAAVARGAVEPARFIILEHRPDEEGLRTVVLVGKSITFDSGGLNAKDAPGMLEMKHDMSGGASVLGAMQAVARLNLPFHVVGLLPATENMPDGRAYRPSDVLKMLSGTTVEVINTDAEGRLVLADALTYAGRFEPMAVVDLATLTGGIVTALGHVASGLMSTDEKLAARIKAAAETTGERVWELPLWGEYEELIKSDVADIKNSGGREASPITGGTFLKHFAKGYSWAHLDIAGTDVAEKAGPYASKGATGVGVRLLVRLLQDWIPPRESSGEG